MSDNVTVYISIGNSDDKLTQQEWARYYSATSLAVHDWADVVHGQWVSEPASAWQNACWCAEIMPQSAEPLRNTLAVLAAEYRQDSIAWAPAVTEFIGAAS